MLNGGLHSGLYGRLDGWLHSRLNGGLNGRLHNGLYGRLDGWLHSRLFGRLSGRLYRRLDYWSWLSRGLYHLDGRRGGIDPIVIVTGIRAPAKRAIFDARP